MATVLVASNYHLAHDPREAALGRPYPPLANLVMAATLRAAGHRVHFYDPMFLASEDAFVSALVPGLTHVIIAADDHNVQQKMCLARMRQASLRMVDMARAAGLPVLVAGPDASTWPEAYSAATGVLVGDAAEAVVEWVEGRPGVTGLHGPGGGGGRRPIITDLDRLPDPAWDLADLAAYARVWRERHGYWELNVWTARGCPYRCNWCAKPTWGRSYQVRSAGRVAAEIARLRADSGMDRIWFTDDIFALRPEWLAAFRAALQEPVPYRCLSRVDLMKDPAFTADLAATGCREVWVGAESGADHVLAAMDKDSNVDEIRAATRLLRKHGIKTGFFLQLGYPGERYPDVLRTAAMVAELRPDEIGVSVSYPHPGTLFHERVHSSMKAAQWSASMDNRTLFEAPYQESFYAAAKELLRSTHSAGQAGAALRAFLSAPDRRAARRLAGAAWHTARLPIMKKKLESLAVPNPRAVERSW